MSDPTTHAWAHYARAADLAPAFAYGRRRGHRRRWGAGLRWPAVWRGAAHADYHARACLGSAGRSRSRAHAPSSFPIRPATAGAS